MKRIALSGKLGQGKFALVDDEDFEKLNKYKWNVTSEGYARRSITLKRQNGEVKRSVISVYMSRLIINTPDGMEADHKDGDTLNNQKYNLRNCTREENEHNKGKITTNTSGYKGVSYDKNRSKYVSSIRVEGRNIYIGRYDNVIDAAYAYNEAAIKYHGEYAKLNKIPNERQG